MAFSKAIITNFIKKTSPDKWLLDVDLEDDSDIGVFHPVSIWVKGPALQNILNIPGVPGRRAALRAYLRTKIVQAHTMWQNKLAERAVRTETVLTPQEFTVAIGSEEIT